VTRGLAAGHFRPAGSLIGSMAQPCACRRQMRTFYGPVVASLGIVAGPFRWLHGS